MRPAPVSEERSREAQSTRAGRRGPRTRCALGTRARGHKPLKFLTCCRSPSPGDGCRWHEACAMWARSVAPAARRAACRAGASHPCGSRATMHAPRAGTTCTSGGRGPRTLGAMRARRGTRKIILEVHGRLENIHQERKPFRANFGFKTINLRHAGLRVGRASRPRACRGILRDVHTRTTCASRRIVGRRTHRARGRDVAPTLFARCARGRDAHACKTCGPR